MIQHPFCLIFSLLQPQDQHLIQAVFEASAITAVQLFCQFLCFFQNIFSVLRLHLICQIQAHKPGKQLPALSVRSLFLILLLLLLWDHDMYRYAATVTCKCDTAVIITFDKIFR